MINFRLTKNSFRNFNLDWWKPTQRQWAPVLLKSHIVPWRQESDPTTGRPWVSLTPKYASVKLRKYPGQPILRATGAMEDTARIFPRESGFAFRSAFYGIYHQNGTSKMQARPWMGVSDKSLEQLVPIAWKNILKKSS